MEIEYQEPTCKEDLELLVEGDKVYIDLKNHIGRIAFLKEEEGILHFITRNFGKISKYMLNKDNIDIKDGWITEKSYSNTKLETYDETNSQYEVYSKIIGELN